MFFGREIFNIQKLIAVSWGFIAFSLIASSIYIINDYRDREDDRKHPVKCKRPLASGAVSPASALVRSRGEVAENRGKPRERSEAADPRKKPLVT